MTLREAGFVVPEFVAFSVQQVNALDSKILADLAVQELGDVSYAVRSSSLSEDQAGSSMAGQFKTVLDVSQRELPLAIDEVLVDAKKKNGDLSEFSLIVIRYVEPDIAGVVFTRNPVGGREIVIEWVKGRGDAVVSGTAEPNRLSFYRHQTPHKTGGDWMADLIEKSLEIEKIFGYPQDIEWAICGDKVYILQSRPITTLSQEEVTSNAYLDDVLPKEDFFYQKTEVTEAAPQPGAETLDLLKSLYASGGPVAKAYAAIGVKYFDTDFLKVIGGQLYVDREQEIKSLFPAYSYLGSGDYLPKPNQLRGLMISIINQGKLRKAKFEVTELHGKIKTRLQQPGESLLDDYELIFTINLSADQVTRRLKTSLPDDVNLAQALAMNSGLAGSDLLQPPASLLGNGLDLHDVSPFTASSPAELSKEMDSRVDAFLLRDAQDKIRLREYGRWLAVWHLSTKRIRTVKAPGLAIDLPETLTGTCIIRQRQIVGISSGMAKGTLVDFESFERVAGEKILFVSALTPDLSKYLGRVAGIVAERGGVLSHFAIIARENKLPVIVGAAKKDWKIGSVVFVDGETGEMRLER